MKVRQRYISNKNQINNLAMNLGIEPLSAELLLSRGFNSPETALAFLYPKLSDIPDFNEYSGVKEAIVRIKQAIANNESIVVYGDYDCDGICASAILSEALKSNGADCAVFIPKRLEEGYGLCVETLEKIAEEYFPDLIITVDCGITSIEEIEYCINELGIDVIVTDHHEPPAVLPDCIVIDPHLDRTKGLYADFCGAGVAFMLVLAMFGLEFACKFIDIAAVATMGDIVPLTGANRIIVKFGIKKLMKSPNFGLKLLMDNLNIKNEITSHDISFKIVPRINSLGRLGDASRAIALFTESDYFVLSCLINEMNDENTERQQLCLKIEAEGDKLAREYINEERAIVLCGEWHKGVLGIAASKLVEKYNRPVILFTRSGNEISGSCRSIPTINIYETLSLFKSMFTRFGGHSQAAGITMPSNNFNKFKKEFFAHLKTLPNSAFIKNVEYDADITEQNVSPKFFDELKLFEPFGYSNPKPVFHFELGAGRFSFAKNNPAHITCQTKFGYQISGFYKGEYLQCLNSDAQKSCLLSLSKNYFNGKEYNQAILEGVTLIQMPQSIDKARECAIYAKSASAGNKKAKVLDKNEFYRILSRSFTNNPCGNIAICYTIETYKQLSSYLIESGIDFEEYYGIKNSDNTLNCIVYSPQKDYSYKYDNCFFADRPLGDGTGEMTAYFTVNDDCVLKENILSQKLDRVKLGAWYIKIKELLSSSVVRTLDFAESALLVKGDDRLEFYLAWLIFEEIDLIYFDREKNSFSINNIRTDLTKSSLYCIINYNG